MTWSQRCWQALAADQHERCKLPWCDCECHAPFSERRAADIETHKPVEQEGNKYAL